MPLTSSKIWEITLSLTLILYEYAECKREISLILKIHKILEFFSASEHRDAIFNENITPLTQVKKN